MRTTVATDLPTERRGGRGAARARMSAMTTFELTATVPATTNIHGEPVGSYTGRYRVSAPGADAAGCVAQHLFKAAMARARLKAMVAVEVTAGDTSIV